MSEGSMAAVPRARGGVTRLIVRWAVRETLGLVVLALALFLSAGRWDWGMGWALVAVTAAWIVGTAVVTIPRHPELLAERVSPKKGTKRWDTAILGTVGMLELARCVVAGLDQRHGWTAGISLPAQAAMLIVVALGYGLFVWAIASNPFFANTVRIQGERGHSVASRGPYRYVRHPAYLGAIIIELAIPVMLGSWWALLPGTLIAGFLVLRTVLEDRTLLRELNGYRDYADRTRHRLLPGVW